MVLITFITGIFKEALAKKIILAIFAFFSLLIILLVLAITNSTVEGIQSMLESTGGSGMKEAVVTFEAGIISKIPMFMLIASFMIIVSSFVPDMLKKGYIDLMLSKPISRTKIVLGQFIAGIILVFTALLFLLGIIWIVISAKSGIWHVPFLYSIFWFTLIFAILYSAVILIGIMTRSTILTILINLLMFFPVSFLLYLANVYFENDKQGVVFGPVTETIIKFFYNILPKAWAIQDICENIVKGGAAVSYQPLITSLLFMGVMLSLAILYFNKKDY
jgi:ABC-type transport system involved in multi-copper enzyme maturation permease subunit